MEVIVCVFSFDLFFVKKNSDLTIRDMENGVEETTMYDWDFSTGPAAFDATHDSRLFFGNFIFLLSLYAVYFTTPLNLTMLTKICFS